MATDQQLVNALQAAAEVLVERKITQEERSRLLKLFNDATGTNKARARIALTQFTGITERQLLEKSAASDNTDRVITDLDKVITDWKPGS